MIVQIVSASIKPEHRDRFIEVVKRNGVESRAEEGCLGYQVAEDLEAPNNFVIVELFSSMDALKEHYLAQFEGIMADLGDKFAAPPSASIHETASTITLEEALSDFGIAVPS